MKWSGKPLVRCTLWGVSAALAVLAITSSPANAQTWSAFGQISPTLGNNKGRLCIGDTNSDLGCPTYAPSLTTAGDVSVTGNLSATKFIGDGSGLTGLSTTGDRIVSTSANIVVGNGGTISLTTGGVSGTAYFDTVGRFVGAGVSTTGMISTTGLYANGLVAIASANAYFTTNYGTQWGSSSSGYSSISGDGSNGASGNYLIFKTSATEAVRIVSSGYVGIGTTAPTAPLTISSPAQFGLIVSRTNSGGWGLGNVGGANFMWSWNPSGTTVGTLGSNATTGYWGLNLSTYSPSVTLQISGTLMIANGGETCDANRLGAIKYTGGEFSFCRNGSSWESLTSIGAGAATFASLTDVSYSSVAGNVFGPGSKTGAVSGVTNSTAFGYSALSAASNSGYDNSAFGYYALNANTTGLRNAALGFSAARSNTTGQYNAAFGRGALFSNQVGGGNTGLGGDALYNMLGNNNTGVGRNTMYFTSNGSHNVAIGLNAMEYNNPASYNVAVGNSAGIGVSNSTSFNGATLLGYAAGQALTTGNSNTLIGYNAGGGITSGANNIVIGTNLSPYSNTGSNQLNVANAIFGDFGNAANLQAKIGVNVTSPTAAMEVSGTVSATLLKLADSPSDVCTAANYGAVKVINGALYSCRQ